ncbi:MAG: PIN domain nuclease [Deltaproteobacteria bacterium]|nr:PIN domain nuclease [Deltaproteobacteria bacterium]MBI3386527.1 PIN domain nuclease [Deltaproteobacteria bacterium]
MIAVDSSVWIDYFNGRATPQTDRLHEALGEQPIVIGDLVLTEVLQGFRSEQAFGRAYRLLRVFPVVSMFGPTLAVRAARNYRALRAAGVTVRKTVDVMIGTYCIERKLPLLYSDRDFDPMVDHLGLKTA